MLFFGICILILSVTLFFYIEKRNRLTALRIEIPRLTKELNEEKEENIRLALELERFENPLHLMELARDPHFGHLKNPYLDDILIVQLPPAPKILSSSKSSK